MRKTAISRPAVVSQNTWRQLLGPLSGPLGSRMERRIWTGLKHQLEDDARTHPA